MKELKYYILYKTGIKLKKVKAKKEDVKMEAAQIATNVINKAIADVTIKAPSFIDSLPNVVSFENGQKYAYVDMGWDDSNLEGLTRFPRQDRYYKGILALTQLLTMREQYRDGWLPDWKDERIIKHSIVVHNTKLEVKNYFGSFKSIWSFQTAEIRDKFMESFKPLLIDYFNMM